MVTMTPHTRTSQPADASASGIAHPAPGPVTAGPLNVQVNNVCARAQLPDLIDARKEEIATLKRTRPLSLPVGNDRLLAVVPW